MAERDPDAAELLLKQLQIEEQAALAEKPDLTASVLREAYHPRKLYSHVAKFYGWTFAEIDKMDYVQFFGCVEDAKEMQEEERRAYSTTQNNHVVNEGEIQAMLPSVRQYDGPTAAV